MSKRDIQHELTLFFLRFIALQGTSILRGYFYVSHKKEALFLGWESRKKVPSYTLQQHRVSQIKNWMELVVNYVVVHLHSWAELICPFLFYS